MYNINRINELISSGDYEAALKECNNALRIFPNDSWLHLTKSDCFSKLHMNEEAIKSMEYLIGIDSCNAEYYYRKALFLLRLEKNLEEALQMAENALLLEPITFDFLEIKGIILSRLERDAESIEIYKKAADILKIKEEALNSDESKLDTSEANTYFADIDNHIKELITLRKAECKKNIARLNFRLSKSLYKMNDYNKALSYCELAISLEPNNSKYKDLRRDITNKKQIEAISNNVQSAQDDLKISLAELNALIGLEDVKSEINGLINYIQVQKMRANYNLPVPKITNHLVFTGNPGTGKTTLARLLGNIYKTIGVLSKGHLIEADRSSLVAGYIGQTALKTKDKIHEALGGILFIDEAYALTNSSSQNDFGKEAIDTLLKAMEDYREDFVVIVAGYPEKMDDFIRSNEGLRSRFNKYIDFKDYNPSDLYKIFVSMCEKNGYFLSDSAEAQLRIILDHTYENRGDNFGNGRAVRNIFDKVLLNHSTRIINTNCKKDDLERIEAEDFNNII